MILKDYASVSIKSRFRRLSHSDSLSSLSCLPRCPWPSTAATVKTSKNFKESRIVVRCSALSIMQLLEWKRAQSRQVNFWQSVLRVMQRVAAVRAGRTSCGRGPGLHSESDVFSGQY